MNRPLKKLSETLPFHLFRPASVAPLAALRIMVASVLLLQASFISSEVLELYGPNALFQGDLNRYLLTQKLPFYVDWFRVAGALSVSGDTLIRGVFLFHVGSLVFLALGFYTRVAAIAAWGTHFVLKINQGYLSSYGVDTFALIFLFYFIFMPVGAGFSVDNYRRSSISAPTAGWNRFCLRVLQFHLCIIYVSSGIAKIQGDQWRTGEVMWRALMMPQFSIFDMSWIHQVPWLAKALAWSTLVLEIGYPALLLPKRVRFWGAMCILGLHLGIAVFMGLWSFGLFMMVLTGCCFLVPSEARGSDVTQTATRAMTPAIGLAPPIG